MSALDKIRSFAEARSGDSVPIRDGLTYADARELLCEVNAARAEVEQLCERIVAPNERLVEQERTIERLRGAIARAQGSLCSMRDGFHANGEEGYSERTQHVIELLTPTPPAEG